jgi:hypothetical protein
MFYVYLTTNFFFMPYYVVMSFQDAINVYYIDILGKSDVPHINSMIIIAAALFIMIYFVMTASMSLNTANIQNQILAYLKFVPIAFASIGGIVLYCLLGSPDKADPSAAVAAVQNVGDSHSAIAEMVGT